MGKITRAELDISLRTELDDIKGYIDATDALLLGQHVANRSNPHSVTKAQVGLGSVSNALQATKTEFDSHVARNNNPHGVTVGQIGAVPSTRTVSTGTGLSGGGALSANRTISLNTTYTDGRYARTGVANTFSRRQRFGRGITMSGSGNTSPIIGNVLEHNGESGQHIYLRVQRGSEIRATEKGTYGEGQYQTFRGSRFINASGQEAYHKGSNIRWGTGSPSGGSPGDIYVQY